MNFLHPLEWIMALLPIIAAIETGGGASVEGNARANRDFVGRDENNTNAGVTFNTFLDSERFNEGDEPENEKEALTWAYVSIFGSKKLGHRGILDRLVMLERDAFLLKVVITLLLIGLLCSVLIQVWPEA